MEVGEPVVEDVIATTVEGEDEYPFISSPVVIVSSTAAVEEEGAALTSINVELLPIVVVIAVPSSGSRCVPISGTNLGHPELFKNNNKASTTWHINETRDTSLPLAVYYLLVHWWSQALNWITI